MAGSAAGDHGIKISSNYGRDCEVIRANWPERAPQQFPVSEKAEKRCDWFTYVLNGKYCVLNELFAALSLSNTV